MFYLPQMYQTHSYLLDVDETNLDLMTQLCTDTISDCKKIYANIFDDIVDEKQLVKPQSLSGAASMLALLLDTIDIDINEM